MPEDRVRTPEVDELLRALLLLDTPDEAYALLLDLCTIREIQDMAQRLEVARMLAAGRRNADRFHGELFAIYVLQEHLTDEDRLANERNVLLARAQDAHVDVLEGGDPVATIMEYARNQGITQVFVGHTLTRRTWWRALARRAPLDRLIRAAEGMDLRVFPQ